MDPSVKRSSPLGISVLISGAGVGGLLSALECWRSGCDVRILERTKSNSVAGDSFTNGPSAHNALGKNWPNLAKRWEEIGYRPMYAQHAITGERLNEPRDFDTLLSSNDNNGHAIQLLRQSRPKFHAAILEQAEEVGISVEYGCEVIEYSEDIDNHQGCVKLRDGRRLTADLVIAADGVGGKSVPLVAGHPVPARSSGRALYRVAYQVERALADPAVAERFPLRDDGKSVIEMWSGPGINAIFWRNEDDMTFILNHPDDDTAEESWSHRVLPDDILKYTSSISGWPEIANRVIKTIPPELLMDFRIMWRDPQPTWTSPRGYVVQLGDAAHTFIPSSGNGATQAIEDAVSLAACLVHVKSKDRIPEAVRVHNLLRFERVSCLQAWGIVNREKQSRQKSSHEDVEKDKITLPRWVTQHDPEQYVFQNYDKALAHLESGESFTNTNIPPGMKYVPWTIDGLLAAHEKGEPTVLDGDWS